LGRVGNQWDLPAFQPSGTKVMKCFTVEEIAEMESVHVETVQQWIRSGELPAHNASASKASKKPRWRVTESDLQTFRIARQNNLGTAAPKTRRPATSIPNYV
jgi:hypothetical protein